MSNKLNEGVVDWILQKAIGLIAGGDYRKAVKAFKGDKEIQKNIAKMAKAQQNMERRLKARAKISCRGSKTKKSFLTHLENISLFFLAQKAKS